ncbi:MAG: DNA primase [Hyphomicrobiales bacterium]|nr:MAG: DNA primase [Hyphomicrobiales bacterium]
MLDQIDLLFIQQDYANRLSTELNRFKVKSYSPYKANARCPVCGDSQKSQTKARFWILERDYNLMVYCHNCGYSHSLVNFLKTYYEHYYQSYILDTKIKKIKPLRRPDPITIPKKKQNPIKGLEKVQDVKIARNYLIKRKIPKAQWHKLYYTKTYYSYINSIIKDKFSDKALKHEHARIVIPFLDLMGNCFGVQGRALDDNAMKYITIMFDDNKKLYGEEDIDYNKTVYCCEGPLDSLFLNNCLAMAGSDVNISKHTVIILDNEPRNLQIVEKYNKYITRGHPICIWPSHIKETDINDMILSGLSPKRIVSVIDANTYSGIKAKIKLKAWRKI